MKFVQERCSICDKEMAMPVVQEDDRHASLIWVQCPSCKEIKPIEINRSREIQEGEPPGEDAPAAASSEPDKAPASGRRMVRHYRAGEKFTTGEWVYHPEWDDTGQVVETERSGGGKEIIVVDFKKSGKKRLVSNFAG